MRTLKLILSGWQSVGLVVFFMLHCKGASLWKTALFSKALVFATTKVILYF